MPDRAAAILDAAGEGLEELGDGAGAAATSRKGSFITTAQKLRSVQPGSWLRISIGRIGPLQARSASPASRRDAAASGVPAVSKRTSRPWRAKQPRASAT